MKFEIVYHELVVQDDIPRLAPSLKKRVKKAIETKLTSHPEQFGKPLRRSLNGYRKLRVGDYRVVFRIDGQIIKIFLIQHRSVVYKNSWKRID
ncbi:type II toxin-antitoxin system RelE/ParE family toxin [Candidatus Peregrinibacteria bacterium]|nr:type II toxin-antitoxin system RelE/ParE family toxin [Candidatus Peregrinibacteria bacterium]